MEDVFVNEIPPTELADFLGQAQIRDVHHSGRTEPVASLRAG